VNGRPTGTCRYDRERELYLTPAHLPACVSNTCPGCLPCTHDEDGHPVRHCTARDRSKDDKKVAACTSHLATGEAKTCARCIGKVRSDMVAIENDAALMPEEAEYAGVNSEAMVLAGPAAHPGSFEARRNWLALHADEVPDPDPHHPAAVLGRWELTLRRLYGQRSTLGTTLARSRAYLDGILTRAAQDPDVDFTKMAAEIAACRSHIEGVRHDSRAPERGATCFLCDLPAPRLVRRYGHWCTREDCERQHDDTGARDTWVCPRDPSHWWSEAEYRLRVGWDALDNADRLTASQMAEVHGINPATLRQWVKRGKVTQHGRDKSGRALYDVDEAIAARDENPKREKANA
jgi:hypothetical protein